MLSTKREDHRDLHVIIIGIITTKIIKNNDNSDANSNSNNTITNKSNSNNDNTNDINNDKNNNNNNFYCHQLKWIH